MGTFENIPSEALDWGPVDDAVARFASKFWGLDTGHSLVPLPQTPEYKLDYLRKTLAPAPNLNRQMIAWVEGRRQKTISGIGKFLDQEVSLTQNILDAFSELPRTNKQAYKSTELGDRLHAHMAAQLSPIEYVYQRYVGYAEFNTHITESAIRVGHTALDLFVFAAGGDEFARLVQETTASFYDQQLKLQQSKPEPAPVDFPEAM